MEKNKRTQDILREMLLTFQTMCVENNLRYFIIGGTALGAMRHQGFIPWDDDIDVGMPRKDYERFKEIFGEKRIGKYYFETEESKDKNYCFCFSKMYDTSTTLIERMSSYLKRGVYIDIFPLDGAGNSCLEAKKVFRKVHTYREIYGVTTIKIDSDRPWYKNIVVISAKFIVKVLFNPQKLKYKICQLSHKYDYDECEYVANFLGAWGYKEIMPKKLFGTPVAYEFEGGIVYGPEYAEEYLKMLYGNWRKLPPKEKQISHHKYYLDLDTAYMD